LELQNVSYAVENKIATITVNRPKVLNALNSATIKDISTAVDAALGDSDVAAVILTGSGEKSFIAGADIVELSKLEAMSGREFALFGQSVLNKIENSPKPFIAAVNGFALGGGCEVAMACHMRIASSTARFGQPEVSLGLIPGYGGSQRLPRIVGKGIALELLLVGGMINAAEAHRIGLANKVIDAFQKDESGDLILDKRGKPQMDKDLFLAEVAKFVGKIINNAPIAIEYTMEALNRGLDGDLETGQNIEADLFGLVCATADKNEGTTAFLEKRQAEFKGA
jgi:enoyl-CoA hydratase